MTASHDDKYIRHTKVAWVIYYLLALVLAAVLVLFVAQDNEERFFYGLMTVASAYVFRPTERTFSKLIFKVTGVSPNTDKE
jgi:hypothetical protein